jgi:hypothetical protein
MTELIATKAFQGKSVRENTCAAAIRAGRTPIMTKGSHSVYLGGEQYPLAFIQAQGYGDKIKVTEPDVPKRNRNRNRKRH